MPKGTDPNCPLGFHPQFRRPNYCKRCFREYSEHKSKDQSGSTTSINSLTSYDPNTNSFTRKASKDEDSTSLYGSRDSLVSSSRQKDEVEKKTLGRSSSEDRSEKDGGWGSSRSSSSSSWGKSRPMSWSAQDLRQAVNDAKDSVYSSKEDLYSSLGGSTRSLDKDVGYETKSSSNSSTDKKDSSDTAPYSFSSYLRTKSPARPPQLKSSTESLEARTGEEKLGKKSTLSSIGEGTTRPPRVPVRLKERSQSAKLPDLRESEGKPKTILSLKEVKSTDDGADASYVVKLRPKPKKVEIDLNSEVVRLQKDNKELEKQMKELSEKYTKIETENKELQTKKPKFGKSSDINKLHQKIDELSDDNKIKNKEVKELKKEIDKRPLPKDVDKTIQDLRSKLEAAEQLCEELMDENEDYKKEIRQMEEEIEEMQDNFREDQADEYRDLKRELEQRAKDCRVLQFKLKKSERRAETLERDKSEAEDKLKELQLGDQDINRIDRIKSLEKELALAKEVSLKMHEEMEKTKKELEIAEVDKKKLKEKVADGPSKTATRYSRASMIGSRQNSQDNQDQLLRDLQATQEREQDLKEQLRFAEEETRGMRKKLSRIEEENETLQLQLNKMSTKAKVNRQRSLERSGSLERQSSVERGTLSRQGSLERTKEREKPDIEDLDPTEMKIQLELNEQESGVLRRKLEMSESENDRLQKELKELLSFRETKKTNSLGSAPETTRENFYFDKKIKLLEAELSQVRKKLIDSETEKDQCKSDLDLSRRRAKMNRSSEQNEADLKRKLEALERDCEQQRSKATELQEENDNLADENKKLQLKSQKRLPLTSQENVYVENQVLQDKVRRLEKRMKDTTQKLKHAESITNLSNCSSDKDAEISDLKQRIKELQGGGPESSDEVSDVKKLISGARIPKVPKDTTPKATLVKWVNELESECGRLQNALKDAERKKGRTEGHSFRDLQDQLQKEKEKAEELAHQLKEERDKSDRSSSMDRRLSSRADDLRRHEDKIQQLKRELEREKDRNSDLMERAKIAEDRGSLSAAEERHKEMSMSWLKERDELKKELSLLKNRKEKLEEDLKKSNRDLESAESKLSKEQKKLRDTQDSQKKDSDEVRKLRSSNDRLQSDVDDLKDTITRLEREKDRINAKNGREMESLKGEKSDLQIRMTTLESELKSEKLKRERIEKEANSKFSARSNAGELAEVHKKLTKAEQEVKRLTADLEGKKSSYETKLKDLEKAKKKEHDQLVDLQVKYDLLEEDFVVQKAQYTTKRESTAEDYHSLKKEYDTIDTELKKLRETYNLRQDTWIKEKLAMQEQVKDLEVRLGRAAGDGSSFIEKNRLKDILEDKNLQIEKLKKDEEILRDQLGYFRREGEELRRKVDDLEKLSELADRRQTTTTKDTSSYETTIRELRGKLATAEKAMKTETTKIKMKYDSKIKALAEEVSTLSSHMSKYKRERDTYKDMVESMQKNKTGLKSGSSSSYRTSRADNANEISNFETQIIDLTSQVTELEDKLADFKLENTKLKNDLVDVKTTADIQLVEAQTKLNEYEEDRLLGGGSRKVPGLRTRLELNWQKEREEQQRLLQETATLAKDLRQTLYEVERERDLEKLESKRKIDQLKRSVNVDHQDTIGKVQELQRDLQELREAHAKLRQINEKLRREKDRTEVEREAMRDKYLGSSREALNQQTKVERMAEEMRRVRDLAPLILGETIDGRDSSMGNLSSAGDAKPKTKEEFTDALKKVVRGMDDLQSMLGMYDDRDRLRRAGSLRRALSIESDDEGSTTGSLRARSVGRGGLHKLHYAPKQQKTNLYRKAQSLDHQMADDRSKIWVSTDAGSTSSIESSMTEEMRKAKYDRDKSLDRISTGSQTSDADAEKKPKGIKGMFSKLKKAKSIEDSQTGGSIVDVGVKAMGISIGSTGSDLPGEVEKDSVKSKIKTLFKGNKGPPSRSQSTERESSSSSSKVKKAMAAFESDTTSVASNTSLSSTTKEVPPVLRRLQGRSSAFGPTVGSSKALQRQSSYETRV